MANGIWSPVELISGQSAKPGGAKADKHKGKHKIKGNFSALLHKTREQLPGEKTTKPARTATAEGRHRHQAIRREHEDRERQPVPVPVDGPAQAQAQRHPHRPQISSPAGKEAADHRHRDLRVGSQGHLLTRRPGEGTARRPLAPAQQDRPAVAVMPKQPAARTDQLVLQPAAHPRPEKAVRQGEASDRHLALSQLARQSRQAKAGQPTPPKAQAADAKAASAEAHRRTIDSPKTPADLPPRLDGKLRLLIEGLQPKHPAGAFPSRAVSGPRSQAQPSFAVADGPSGRQVASARAVGEVHNATRAEKSRADAVTAGAAFPASAASPSPTAPNTPAPTPTLNQSQLELYQQAAQTLERSIRLGESRASIRLYPEHLGALQIALQHDGDGVRAVLIAQTSEAQQLLSAQLTDLQQSLKDLGVTLLEAEVYQHDDPQAQRRYRELSGADHERAASQAAPSRHGEAAQVEEQPQLISLASFDHHQLDLIV